MAEGGLGGKAVRIGDRLIVILLLLSNLIPHVIRCTASADCGDNDIRAAGFWDIGCRGGWIC